MVFVTKNNDCKHKLVCFKIFTLKRDWNLISQALFNVDYFSYNSIVFFKMLDFLMYIINIGVRGITISQLKIDKNWIGST